MKPVKIFFLLTTVVILIIIGLLFFLWSWSHSPLYRSVLTSVLLLLFTGVLGFILLNALFLFIGANLPEVPAGLLMMLHFALNIIYPFIRAAGLLFGMDKEKIQRIYIHIHNRVTCATLKKDFKPEEILVLLPHCLQLETCVCKITLDINECLGCGHCVIAGMKEFAAEGIRVKVVPGGTIARKIIKQYQPRFILAVACENDLSQGLMGISKCPVIGVVNKRPHGPCRETTCSVPKIAAILKKITCLPVEEKKYNA